MLELFGVVCLFGFFFHFRSPFVFEIDVFSFFWNMFATLVGLFLGMICFSELHCMYLFICYIKGFHLTDLEGKYLGILHQLRLVHTKRKILKTKGKGNNFKHRSPRSMLVKNFYNCIL